MRIVWELDANAEHARVQIHRLGGSRVDLDQVALEAEAESE